MSQRQGGTSLTPGRIRWTLKIRNRVEDRRAAAPSGYLEKEAQRVRRINPKSVLISSDNLHWEGAKEEEMFEITRVG